MEFRILGPLQATAGPAEVVLARRERILLALLLLSPNQPVTVERISEAIWGQRQPRKAAGQVHGTVYRLRRQLVAAGIPEAVILTDPSGYRTQINPQTLDLTRFRQLRDQARAATAGDPDQAVAQYRAGLDLWRGPALAGLDSDLLRQAAAALEEEHLQAWQECLQTELMLGRAGELVAELTDLVGQHPHREGLHRLLMLALYRAGRQADALAAYRRARQLLRDELGIEPGAELQRLHQAILNRDPELNADRSQPTPAATTEKSPVPKELPADVAGFTGRALALSALDEMLTAGKDSTPAPVIVSAIAGMAGVGKTALAVHWAHRTAGRFPDGQLYLNLRGYATETPVRPIEALHTILRSLGVKAEEIPADEAQAAGRYRSELAERRVLVLLDNAGSVEQVRPLLPGSAGCLVLVTSRDRLAGLVARDGACRLTLDVLTPDESHDLLARLLGDKRVAAEPKASAELAQACAYLPLALRIAASGLLDGPEQPIGGYVAELRAGDRLSMLRIDGDEESALRAAFDLSYRRLPAEARRLFRLLGLVPGADFAAPAAAALGDLPKDQARAILARLTSAHLVEQHVPGRYTFHDLLRLYARERAEQEDDEWDRQDAVHRLLVSYVSRADAAANSLYQGSLRLPTVPSPIPSQETFATPAAALAWLDVERSNLVSAIEHAADHGPRRLAWLIADSLRRYFFNHRHSVDALRAGTAALAAAEHERDLPAQAIMSLGLWDALVSMGRYEAAIERCVAARELARMAGWEDGEGGALMNLGSAYLLMGQLQPARRYLTEALRLYQRTGQREREVRVLTNLGYLHRRLGDLQQDADYCSQQVAIYREFGPGHADGHARALVNLSAAELDLGLLNQATEHLAAALALQREHGDPVVEANVLDELANVHLAAGRLDEAVELAHKAMSIARDLRDPRQESMAWCTLGRVHQEQEQATVAVDCYARAADIAHHTRARDVEIEALIGLAAATCRLDQCEEASGHALRVLESARKIGYRVYEGKALTVLAEIRLAQGRHEEACAYARQAVENHRETGHRLGEVSARAALVAALHRSGDLTAVEHSQAARELLTAIGAPVPDGLAKIG